MTDTARFRRLVTAAVVVLGIGAIAVYGPWGTGNSAARECGAAKSVTQRLMPLARGEVAAVAVANDPKPLPDLAFLGPDGGARTLSSFKGRTILLNLWATWCAPCRHEMPAPSTRTAAVTRRRKRAVSVIMRVSNGQEP